MLQKDICQRFVIPKQTVNAIIKTLTDKGWLELKVSEQDRRSRNLCLTPVGSAQAAQIARALQEHEAQVWLRLGLDRAEQLIEHTALYNRHFREVAADMHIRKEFFRFVIPSMLAFALSGIYAIADGLLCGKRAG